MNDKEKKKMSLLAEIACDYYERGLDQGQIAEKLNLSRSRISRLLKEVLKYNLVSFKINYNYLDFERHYEIEERLKERYSLKNARVLNSRGLSHFTIKQSVAQLAAKYIQSKLRKNMILGTGWGTALRDIAFSFSADTSPESVNIIQLAGNIPCSSANCTANEIASLFAEHLHCHADFLNIPLYIPDDYVREKMCNEPNTKMFLQKGIFSDLIVTEVSDMDSVIEEEFWHNYVTPELYLELKEKGAIGAILGRFYDSSGKEIKCEWNRKCTSISLSCLKDIPEKIAVVTSIKKVPATLAAIHGHFIDTLIVDGSTAVAIWGEKNIIGL